MPLINIIAKDYRTFKCLQQGLGRTITPTSEVVLHSAAYLTMVPKQVPWGPECSASAQAASRSAGTALPSLLSQIGAENKPLLQVSARQGSAWEGFSRARQHPQMGSSSSQNAEELSVSTVEVPIFHTDSSCATSQGTGQCSQSPWYRGRLRGFAQKTYSFIDFTGHVNVLHMSSLKSLMMRVHGSQQKIRRADSKRLFMQQLVDL